MPFTVSILGGPSALLKKALIYLTLFAIGILSDRLTVLSGCQAPLTCLAVKTGYRGVIRIPRDAEERERVLGDYGEFIEERDNRLWELVEERTAGEDIQEKVLGPLLLIMRK